MAFFRWLFGKRPKRGADKAVAPGPDGSISPAVAAVVSELKARAQPCVRLEAGGDGESRLGGVPDMATAWPRYRGRPLCCVAQVDLGALRMAGGPDWLPSKGRLLFFYELEHSSWGLYPEDAGSFVVIHDTAPAAPALVPEDLPEEARFPAYPVTFLANVSYPTEERAGIDWGRLDPSWEEALWRALGELQPPAPAHQIGGYPSPIQGDGMEAECQSVAPRRSDDRGVADWRLLLQLDTDDDAGMMWGDVGSLYFWVREKDARAGDFSRIWLILQCH